MNPYAFEMVIFRIKLQTLVKESFGLFFAFGSADSTTWTICPSRSVRQCFALLFRLLTNPWNAWTRAIWSEFSLESLTSEGSSLSDVNEQVSSALASEQVDQEEEGVLFVITWSRIDEKFFLLLSLHISTAGSALTLQRITYGRPILFWNPEY